MYYDGTKLLSLKDLDGDIPEIYICTSNRSAGKTTYFSRLLVNNFLNSSKKFMLVYRYIDELSDVAVKFFSEIGNLFFDNFLMTEQTRAKGKFKELFLENKKTGEIKSCGYAVALNGAYKIKKYSHVFNDVETMFMDEFLVEDNTYLSDEISKFQSLHMSVARGGGKQSRYVRFILAGNTTSVFNPYYSEMDIAYRIQKNTKFLRGYGWVLEQGFNESAQKAQQESSFNKAFRNSRNMKYMCEGIYLNDNDTFISKANGDNDYIMSLVFNGKYYCLRRYDDFLYCSDNVDKSFKMCYAISENDISPVAPYIKANGLLIIQLIQAYFNAGALKFKNLECKHAIYQIL